MSYTVQLHRTLAPHTSLKLCLITSSWPLTPLLLTVFSSVKWSSSGRVALCFYSHALMLALHMTLTVECAACCLLFKWLIKFSAALSQWTPGFLQEQRLWFFISSFQKNVPLCCHIKHLVIHSAAIFSLFPTWFSELPEINHLWLLLLQYHSVLDWNQIKLLSWEITWYYVISFVKARPHTTRRELSGLCSVILNSSSCLTWDLNIPSY